MPPTGEQTLLDNGVLALSLPNDLPHGKERQMNDSDAAPKDPAGNATCWHQPPTTPWIATSAALGNSSTASTPRELGLRNMSTRFEASALEDPFLDSDAELSGSTVSDSAVGLAGNGHVDTGTKSDARERIILWSLPEPVGKEDSSLVVRSIFCSLQDYPCLPRIRPAIKRATRLIERSSLTMNCEEEEADEVLNIWPSTWGAWSNSCGSPRTNAPSTASSQSGGSSPPSSVTSSDDAQDRQKRRATESDHIFDHGGFPDGSIWALDSTPEAREYFRTVSEGEKLPRHPFVIGTTSGGVAVGMTCSSHPPRSTASTTKKGAKKDRNCPCHLNILVPHLELVQGKAATGHEVGTNIKGTMRCTTYLLPQRVVAVPLKFLVGQYKQCGKPAIVSDDFLAPFQRSGYCEKVISDVEKWKHASKAYFLTSSIDARKAYQTGPAPNRVRQPRLWSFGGVNGATQMPRAGFVSYSIW